MSLDRTIFNTLLPSFAFDSVAVFDQSFQQVFPQARSIKAVIKEESKVMEHPIETGGIITDHRIILPVTIELSLIVQSKSGIKEVYQAIKQYYLNATLLVVQTKSSVYENQMISSMPHEENPDQYDALAIALTLKQVQFATTRYSVVPKNPKNSSTVDRGTQSGTALAPDSSAAKDLENYLSKALA